MTTRTYSAQGFKQALEGRLRAAAKDGQELERRRQRLVFDRFLARVSAAFGKNVALKGGLALELRIVRARTTRDVDLRMSGAPGELLETLRAAGRVDQGDFMSFEVEPNKEHPEIQGTRYDGLRFRAVCRLADKPYGRPFGVDVAFGDPIFGEPDHIVAEDRLGFVGVAPPTIGLIPIETHIAEKLHAYTMPLVRVNTRVRDLPDIALLATARALDAARLIAALEQTFTFRATHTLPDKFPDPVLEWGAPYSLMASEDRLRWATLPEVTSAARSFIAPVLAGKIEAVWDPDAWAWTGADGSS